MPVIGHETPGEQPHARHMIQRLAQQIDEGLIVLRLVEEFHPSVASIEHMLHHPSAGYACDPGHTGSVADQGNPANDECPLISSVVIRC